MRGEISVLNPGFLTTLQDLGRKQYLDQGFPKGGAMDRNSVQLLNTLLENSPNAPVIEFCQIGPTLKFHRRTIIAVSVSGAMINDQPISPWVKKSIHKGGILSFNNKDKNVWGYIALIHGFLAENTHGSCSTHLHLGIGGLEGRALKLNDRVHFPSTLVRNTNSEFGIAREFLLSRNDQNTTVRCVKGAQWNWFSDSAKHTFLKTPYTITQSSNRVGYRLNGLEITRNTASAELELTSEGAYPGTIQVPQNGQPIALMSDTQLIGGYPKIANIIYSDIPILAQSRPGSKIYFEMISLDEATEIYKQQCKKLKRLEHVLSLRKNFDDNFHNSFKTSFTR